MIDYQDFINRKLSFDYGKGFDVEDLPEWLFPHQVDLTRWALRRGRSAIFADTGLGKTRMQLAWANEVHNRTGGNVLILAPLAVSDQTVGEGCDVGVTVTHCRDGSDVMPGINITNYERLHRFNPSEFVGVVLDESSIIKHESSKTLSTLLDAFARTEYKLCATATPAPNDWTELGTHAEFLGIRSGTEMLCEFFVHDGGETQNWRLKKHARKEFWKWVSSWAAMVRSPADLGHDASAYDLPPMRVHHHVVESQLAHGQLFALEAQTLSDRRSARRESLSERVQACADIVNASSDPWIVWCDLNAEDEALKSAIHGAVSVRGSDYPDTKEKRLLGFSKGDFRVLVSKPSIAGWGMNWQHCHNVAFVGVTDSWESYYQAVRRCWRFGQKNEVHIHIFASESEGAVINNLARKETDAKAMQDALSAETRESVRESVIGFKRETNEYKPHKSIVIPQWMNTEAS